MEINTKDLQTLIDDYLAKGKVLHLATSANGVPWMSHVWYAVGSSSNTLVFTSNRSRRHSVEISNSPVVAGGVVAIDLDGLGQKVQGLSFEGRAFETSGSEISSSYEAYARRWPQVRQMFTAKEVETGATNMRMYMIKFMRVVLFDEVAFPGDPRKELVIE